MQMKKVIINADDFGLTKEINESVKLGFQSGLITSASIITNTEHFYHAADVILPQIENIDLGFHFNIVEGKSLTHPSLLCDDKGFFNNSYVDLLFKMNNKNVLLQIEQEFEAQIEKVLKYHEISHLDSHVHVHSIPSIFKLFIKMAKKYNIKYIRLQKEIPYCIIRKSLNKKYMINIIKNILLNSFSFINSKVLKNESDIKTNDYLIGVLYTGFMDENTIINGLKCIKKENSIVEIILHPSLCIDEKNTHDLKYNEFLITQNMDFLLLLNSCGYRQSNYQSL